MVARTQTQVCPTAFTGPSCQNRPQSAVCPSPLSAADVPFSRWSADEVCGWLQEQGLGLYGAQCQSWVRSGQTLLQASQHDLEKVRRVGGASGL